MTKLSNKIWLINKSWAKICQIAIFRKKERSKHKGQSNSMSDSMNSLKNNLKLGQNRVSPILPYLFEYKTSLTFEVRHFRCNFYQIMLTGVHWKIILIVVPTTIRMNFIMDTMYHIPPLEGRVLRFHFLLWIHTNGIIFLVALCPLHGGA